jgi:hypothetical protein
LRVDLAVDALLERFDAFFCNVLMGDEVLHLRLDDPAGLQVVWELLKELAVEHVPQVNFMTVLVGGRWADCAVSSVVNRCLSILPQGVSNVFFRHWAVSLQDSVLNVEVFDDVKVLVDEAYLSTIFCPGKVTGWPSTLTTLVQVLLARLMPTPHCILWMRTTDHLLKK